MDDPFDLDMPAPPRPGGAMPVPSYVTALNPEQRAAVEATEGPVLMLAGAGTGKTRALTARLAYILDTGRAMPGQLLAVTFTNKAAREMRERVEGLLRRPLAGMWLGTFHAMAARMLRYHAEAVGLQPNFTILDADDAQRLLKQVMEEADVDTKRWPPRALAIEIGRWKDRGLAPDQVTSTEGGHVANGRGIDIYRTYQARLKAVNAVDFGDLLLHCLTLFRTNPDVLQGFQDRFRYVLVDEYQDTNVSQYLWLRLLAQTHKNICCVGDDDQSIYGWRGAEVGNILRFEQDFPGAKVIRLERNYRSTPHILGAASGLIANNGNRLGKTLWTELNEGERVRVHGVWDGHEEARFVADELEAKLARGDKLAECAILVRAGFQTRTFEERFLTIGLPYRIFGGLRFYERAEVKDAVAYLRVIAQPDDDLAFERIVNKPKRKIGDKAIQTLYRAARAGGVSLYRAAWMLIETEDLPAVARRPLARLLAQFDDWRALAAALTPDELTEKVIEESGYREMWQRDKSPEAPGRLENLDELCDAIGQFESLAGFLEHISLVLDNDAAAEGDAVGLMTLHAAKGLEFDTVYLPGWEEGLFPHQRAMDESGNAGLEEERRLAYVGLTRAKRVAVVSYAGSRQVHGQWTASLPSRFVGELPEAHTDVDVATGVSQGEAVWRGGWQERTAPRLGFEEADVPFEAPRPSYGPRRSRWSQDAASGGAPAPTGLATVTRTAPADLGPGVRVFHQKFGYGIIEIVENDKLTIAFEKAGTKKVMAGFVTKA